MKKYILLLFSLLPFFVFAQDVIYRTNGEILDCNITNEDSIYVYFDIFKNGREVSTSLKKTEIKEYYYNSTKEKETEKIVYDDSENAAITIGFLQGGGSLIGLDFEALVTDRVGIQAGAGFVGFGFALNYHFKPTIRSTFLSLTYWHQGIGESFAQSVLGPTIVFRGKRWFTAQIGFGFPLDLGPALENTDYEQPPFMLLYSIGAYIPF